MTKRVQRLFFAALAMSFLSADPLAAQDPDTSYGPAPAAGALARQPRKTTGFFRKPAAETPALQMKYANDLYQAGRAKAAGKHYDALVCKWPESPFAVSAQLSYARILDQRGRGLDAFNEYQYLVDYYPGSFPFEEALDRQYVIADEFMKPHRGWLFTRGPNLERALPLLEQIGRNGPQWKNAPHVQYTIGWIYEQQGKIDEAIKAYERTFVSHPRTPDAEAAGYRRALCLHKRVQDSPRDESTYREALSALSAYLRDNPNSRNAAAAQSLLDELKERLALMYFERAEYYDKIAKRPRAALIGYADFIRNFPTSELAAKASDRIDVLKTMGDKE